MFCLVAGYLKELIEESGLSLEMGLVQTAYANGSSTDYISNTLVSIISLNQDKEEREPIATRIILNKKHFMNFNSIQTKFKIDKKFYQQGPILHSLSH